MKPRHIAFIHLGLAVVWTVLIIPTVLWWKESILWVALMSAYAIVVSHLATYDGARAEEKVDKK